MTAKHLARHFFFIGGSVTSVPFTFSFFPQVIILCTTFAIFGTSIWFFVQSASKTSSVYVPTIIFAGMSSLITMVTPTLQYHITGNSKVSEPF